jgi:hypothetical protein
MASSNQVRYKDGMHVGLSRILAAGIALAPAAASADDGFWRHWGDGKAELSGYRLVQPRYGSPRAGTAVLIYVTEDFSDAARVKADPGRHPPGDVYPVLKLNFVKKFQTGIYDYSVLTSTFVRTDGPPLAPVKTSFSSQEWCGHVYQQWLVRGDALEGALHSYFDGEADAAPRLPMRLGGVLEDAVPILVRELRGPWLQPGETRTVPFFPSLGRARLQHQPSAWTEARITRSAGAAPVKTALGTLPAFTYVVEAGGERTTWTIEAAAPHRVLAWRSSSGDEGQILGSARLPYWLLNGPDGARELDKLGLPATGAPRR